MSRRQVETDLEGLPPSDELIDACDGELTPDDLQEIRGMELDPSDTLGCLWAELLKNGIDPEEFFRKKGIIQ
jgi:hypothetical protein